MAEAESQPGLEKQLAALSHTHTYTVIPQVSHKPLTHFSDLSHHHLHTLTIIDTPQTVRHLCTETKFSLTPLGLTQLLTELIFRLIVYEYNPVTLSYS